MPEATISNISYVNKPKGRGPASVKDEKNRYWRFWTKEVPLSSFSVGGTYVVEFHIEESEEYGKQYYIDRLISGAAPAAAVGGSGGYSASMPPDREEAIAAQAILKCQGPLPVGDVAAIAHALKAGAMAWRQFKKWQKEGNVETGVRRQSVKPEDPDPEFNDEIPY